jgi:hypothetical protein
LPSIALASPASFIARTIEENRSVFHPVGNHHAVSAGSSLATAVDSLLDQATAEVGVDQPAFGAHNGFEKACVCDSFVPGESRKPSRLESLHFART